VKQALPTMKFPLRATAYKTVFHRGYSYAALKDSYVEVVILCHSFVKGLTQKKRLYLPYFFKTENEKVTDCCKSELS
jgi:hypothetical protein